MQASGIVEHHQERECLQRWTIKIKSAADRVVTLGVIQERRCPELPLVANPPSQVLQC
jgi:hypothetical protein